PRWKGDNVIVLELEMPERRTKDYESGMMGFWLDRIASNEDDVEIIVLDENLQGSNDDKDSGASGPTMACDTDDKDDKEVEAWRLTSHFGR
ncbi:hypothetical protein DYB31_007819, partial [Aphanomyces astaci]